MNTRKHTVIYQQNLYYNRESPYIQPELYVEYSHLEDLPWRTVDPPDAQGHLVAHVRL
jgi:hypothetical protein